MSTHSIWAHFSHMSQHRAWLSSFTILEQEKQGASSLCVDIVLTMSGGVASGYWILDSSSTWKVDRERIFLPQISPSVGSLRCTSHLASLRVKEFTTYRPGNWHLTPNTHLARIWLPLLAKTILYHNNHILTTSETILKLSRSSKTIYQGAIIKNSHLRVGLNDCACSFTKAIYTPSLKTIAEQWLHKPHKRKEYRTILNSQHRQFRSWGVTTVTG